MKIEDVIKEYQCPGCVCDSFEVCYEKESESIGCSKHVAGTMITNIGRVFLGMPKGFDRLGAVDNMSVFIYRDQVDCFDYDKFNVPVWKFKDTNGCILVRGIHPRLNQPFIHIFMDGDFDKIDCLEITQSDIDAMD